MKRNAQRPRQRRLPGWRKRWGDTGHCMVLPKYFLANTGCMLLPITRTSAWQRCISTTRKKQSAWLLRCRQSWQTWRLPWAPWRHRRRSLRTPPRSRYCTVLHCAPHLTPQHPFVAWLGSADTPSTLTWGEQLQEASQATQAEVAAREAEIEALQAEIAATQEAYA